MTDADALVTGSVAVDIDSLITAKLVVSQGSSPSDTFATHFKGMCSALCTPPYTNTSLAGGRRMNERASPSPALSFPGRAPPAMHFFSRFRARRA